MGGGGGGGGGEGGKGVAVFKQDSLAVNLPNFSQTAVSFQ